MKIRNTTAKALVLPSSKKTGRELLTIPPGLFDVPDRTFEEIVRVEQNPIVLRWLESGKLTPAFAREAAQAPAQEPNEPASTQTSGGSEIDGQEGGQGVETDLSGFNATEAAELIEAEEDRETLKAWLASEKRKGVRALLEARLAGLGA